MSRATIDIGAGGVPINKAQPPVHPLQLDGSADEADTDTGIGTFCSGDAPHITDVVYKLRTKLERYHHKRARRAGWRRRFVPTGLKPLDAVLPQNGLPCGAITEIFSNGCGVGSMALAMRMAGRCVGYRQYSNTAEVSHPDPRHVEWIPPATAWAHSKRTGETHPTEPSTISPSRGEKDPSVVPPYQGQRSGPWTEGKEGGSTGHRYIVLIDTAKDFYPPAAWQYGLTLDRLVIIRPATEREAFWATEQVLRCSGVAAVIASLTNLEEPLSRRLQLAAESSGCIGLLLRSTSRRVKSFAAIQMLVEGTSTEELKTYPQTTPGAAGFSLRGHSQIHATLRTTDIPRGLKPAAQYRVSTPPIIGDVRVCRITLLKVREGMPTGPLLVDLHHETGTWSLHPIPVERPATKLA